MTRHLRSVDELERPASKFDEDYPLAVSRRRGLSYALILFACYLVSVSGLVAIGWAVIAWILG